jgi:hypothetical protein
MGATSAELYANTTVQIRTNTAGVSNNWTFGADGTLTFPDNTVQTTAPTNIDSLARSQANSAFNQANTATSNAATANSIAVSAFAQANTGTTLAQASYDYANTIVVPSLTGYAVNTTVNLIWSTANNAYTQANSATTLAQAAYDKANTAGTGSSEYILTGSTTNNTETEIFVGGVSSSRIGIANNTFVYYTVDIASKGTGSTTDLAAFYLKGAAVNNSNVVSDTGSLYEVVVTRSDANMLVDVRADNTNKTLNLYVTGVSGKTFSWKATVTTMEI